MYFKPMVKAILSVNSLALFFFLRDFEKHFLNNANILATFLVDVSISHRDVDGSWY